MAQETESHSRRYTRVRGPFDGDHLGESRTPVLIYDLNLGGGLVNFCDEQPTAATLTLKIDLPREGPIIVHAETVYRRESSVAVRFVDLDRDSAARLTRTIDSMAEINL